MLQAALADGTAHRRCVFEVFTRRLPAGRRYGVRRGYRPGPRGARAVPVRRGRARLARAETASSTTRRWPTWRVPVHRLDRRVRRGECFFPSSPVMVVEGTSRRPCCWRRSCSRSSTTTRRSLRRLPDDQRRRRPAVPGDGLAPHARGGRGRCGPRGVRRRLHRHLEPRGRPPLRLCRPSARPRTPSRSCTTTRRGVRGAGRRAGPGRRCSSTPTTSAAASSWPWTPPARRSGRCGSTPATWRCSRTRSAPSWTRRRAEHEDHGDADLDEYAIAALAVAPVDTYGVGTRWSRGPARRRADGLQARRPRGCRRGARPGGQGRAGQDQRGWPQGGGAAAGHRRPGGRGGAGRGRRRATSEAGRPRTRPCARCTSRSSPTGWSTRAGSARTACARQRKGTAPRGTSCRAGRGGCLPTRQRCRP